MLVSGDTIAAVCAAPLTWSALPPPPPRLRQRIGEEWIIHLEQLGKLKPMVSDAGFVRAVQKVKQENKMKVAQMLTDQYQVQVNSASMFDIQVSQW